MIDGSLSGIHDGCLERRHRRAMRDRCQTNGLAATLGSVITAHERRSSAHLGRKVVAERDAARSAACKEWSVSRPTEAASPGFGYVNHRQWAMTEPRPQGSSADRAAKSTRSKAKREPPVVADRRRTGNRRRSAGSIHRFLNRALSRLHSSLWIRSRSMQISVSRSNDIRPRRSTRIRYRNSSTRHQLRTKYNHRLAPAVRQPRSREPAPRSTTAEAFSAEWSSDALSPRGRLHEAKTILRQTCWGR